MLPAGAVLRIANPADQVATLERLLAISAAEPVEALIATADLVAEAFGAEKVDVFLFDAARDTLVALGSSTQPLSALQKKHGLDTLAIGNGGRTVEVFLTGRTYVSGDVDQDREELRGIREKLGIRSQVGVALEMGATRRGVLLLASQTRGAWSETDARFAETVGRWVSAVLRQSEMVKALADNAVTTGRRMAAEELLTVFAHDVRNLIYPVDLSMHVVQRRAERAERGDDVRDATKARTGLARLSALVNDVLDVARLERGLMTFDLESTPLVAFLGEIAGVVSTAAHVVVVSAPGEIHALVDPARFRQALENILANAVKHSPAGAPVNVIVERRAVAGGFVAAIHVTDEGPGIAADLAPHIFQRGVSGGSGLGLGLYLARQIALGHGGDLAVESRAGAGARFVVTLPCDGPSGQT